MDFTGKVAIVTGSGRGIGKAIAMKLAENGATLVINDVGDSAPAEQTVAEIKNLNRQATAIMADVSSSAEVTKMVENAIATYGKVDILVNNAGITRDRTILKMTNGEWNEVLDVNLSGSFWCLREASRVMAKEGRGAIINMASIMAMKPGFGNANYCASKAGLVALTKAAAKELGRFHVTVNAVLPGFHETDMAAGLPAAHKKKVLEEHVTGRSTRMEDLCRIVLEIAQNPSVSGQVINVDSRVV